MALYKRKRGSIRLHKAPACALRASLCSPSPTHRGQLDTRAFSAKRKIELLVARFLRAGGSRRKSCKTGHRVPATTPRPTASSPLFSQIASRWFDILPWQPEEANLDLARAIPPPPRARHCTCPPARPSAILEEPPGFRRQDLRRDASEQPRWLISDASERPRAEPTRLRDFV